MDLKARRYTTSLTYSTSVVKMYTSAYDVSGALPSTPSSMLLLVIATVRSPYHMTRSTNTERIGTAPAPKRLALCCTPEPATFTSSASRQKGIRNHMNSVSVVCILPVMFGKRGVVIVVTFGTTTVEPNKRPSRKRKRPKLALLTSMILTRVASGYSTG